MRYPVLNDDAVTFDMFPHPQTMDEDPNIVEKYSREIISDFSPDKPFLADEFPREDNWSEAHLNLTYEGTRGEQMLPWKNDEYDLQHYDQDPRGALEEQPWRKFREIFNGHTDVIQFANDSDYSIPSSGISPEYMMAKKNLLFNFMQSRQQFDESIDVVLPSGRGPAVLNTKKKIVLSGQIIDTTDLPTLRNMNSVISNNLHTGSRYFHNTTTTDQRLPVQNYGFIFKNLPTKPKPNQSVIEIKQRAETRSRTRDLFNFLSGSSGKAAKMEFTTLEKQKFKQLMDVESTPQNNVVIKDIMALLGVTEADIKYSIDRESTTKKQKQQILACTLQMIGALEKLPLSAQISMRDELLFNKSINIRCKGGVSPVIINPKIKKLIESRTQINGNNITNQNYALVNNFRESRAALQTKKAAPKYTLPEADLEFETHADYLNQNAKYDPTIEKNVAQTDHDIAEEIAMAKKSAARIIKLKDNRENDIEFGPERAFEIKNNGWKFAF